MKVISLIKKLNKLNIINEVTKTKDIKFTIENNDFFASIQDDIILSFYKETGYDRAEEKAELRFFDNLKQILAYINNKKQLRSL